MRLIATLLATCILVSTGNLGAEPVRAAYPSANVQFLPAFVALEKASTSARVWTQSLSP